VVEVRVRSGEWHHHSILDGLGKSARAFINEAVGDVGLLEVCVRCVKDEWFPLPELMLQQLGKAGVGALGYARSVEGRLALLLIVVDVKMLGPDDFEIK
jgi:hypothetical protein